jgi:5-methylcytosine-specific restriction protein A
MTHVGRRDRQIWDEFADDLDGLSRAAATIRRELELASGMLGEDADDEETLEFPEGRLAYRLHSRRERSHRLVQQKKRQALSARGALTCEVCGFDFSATYGELGAGYIECHHLVPVSQWAEGIQRTKLSDIALTCSNCHRMLHRRQPWPSVEDLAGIVRR